MKTFLTFLIVGLSLSGCASTPAPDPWADLTVETDPATPALDCGSFPGPASASEGPDGTLESITYDVAGTNALEQYRVCSEANQANVDEHAAQIAELKIVRKELTGAGAGQRRIADMRLEMLEDERRHHMWSSVVYIAIAIAGIAL